MNVNTELCVDLKTKLLNDVVMVLGKEYHGILRRDIPNEGTRIVDNRFTFVEALPSTTGKRNPHVFVGKYITITRRDDGSLQPNFKTLKEDANFSPVAYAKGVANELLWALESLLEKEAGK